MAVQSGALLGGLDSASVGMIRAGVGYSRLDGAAKSVDGGMIVSDKSCLQ